MKKGDVVRSDLGWLAEVTGFTNKGKNVDLVWKTGKLQGRVAKVPKELLKVAAQQDNKR